MVTGPFATTCTLYLLETTGHMRPAAPNGAHNVLCHANTVRGRAAKILFMAARQESRALLGEFTRPLTAKGAVQQSFPDSPENPRETVGIHGVQCLACQPITMQEVQTPGRLIVPSLPTGRKGRMSS
jgi:hypothetical protein